MVVWWLSLHQVLRKGGHNGSARDRKRTRRDNDLSGQASRPEAWRARNAAAFTRFWQAVEQNWRVALREVST
ncbi:hypothetical protein GCM10027569_65290 [Flindersiella endophytica]